MDSTKLSRQLAREEFLGCAGQLKELRKLIRDRLNNEGCGHAFVERMVLAVTEASMNIIQHGYGSEITGTFQIEIISNGDELTFRLTDSAPKVDLSSIKSRALDDIRPGGLGVHFIRELMDHVEYLENEEGSNVLQMTKRIA